MSAEYDVPRQQRLRRALEAIADAYGFTGELRSERIGEWWLYPNSIDYDREQEIAHEHGLEVKFGKEHGRRVPPACRRSPAQRFLNPILVVGNGRRFRVLDVVPFEEEDESPFVGLLQVEGI